MVTYKDNIMFEAAAASGALLVKLAECLLRSTSPISVWLGTLSRPLLGKLVLLYLVWAQSVTDTGNDL